MCAKQVGVETGVETAPLIALSVVEGLQILIASCSSDTSTVQCISELYDHSKPQRRLFVCEKKLSCTCSY